MIGLQTPDCHQVFDVRYPVILPAGHNVSDLLAQHAQATMRNSRKNHVLSETRKGFMVVSNAETVR